MSPASKSKSKKSGKDSQKATSKPSALATVGSAVAASAYNPLLGIFHSLDTIQSSSASPLPSNGRFRNIDETDEQTEGSLGFAVEYDSVSNNGSWSGESEDHKDKVSNEPVRREAIPGADNEKREKIRQKNERKHQRQKEKRAQELHEKCSGYIMSRKLEVLAQKLEAMGFSQERATMALINNDGKLEESVSWLFEVGEEADKHKESAVGGASLKIDISEELAKMASMEIRYRCTKQEVERAVVAAEGDLVKAEESLKSSKQNQLRAPPKPEERIDPPTVTNGKETVASSQHLETRPQPKPVRPVQPRRDEKDLNYTKASIAVVGSSESVTKSFQPLNRIPPKMEWLIPQQMAMPPENKWPNAGGSNPSVSYSLSSTIEPSPPPTKIEHRYAFVGSDFKKLQPSVREPVLMMQQAQSINAKQVPATSMSSAPVGSAASWYSSSSVDIMKSNGLMPHVPSSRSLSPNNLTSSQMFQQLHHQQQHYHTPGNVLGDSSGTGRVNGLWSRTGASSPISAASSLGLFSALGSTGSSGATSPVDWSTGGTISQLDYTHIDWSLGPNLASSKPNGLWLGASSLKSTHMYDPNTNGLIDKQAMRLMPTNGNGVTVPILHDNGVIAAEASAAVSHEWTSPFEGKDLFSLPRQFVSSPSL